MRTGFYLDHPAKSWETGLAAGNGRQGAVLYGGIAKEQLLLNEESLWYGAKRERTQDAGWERLKTVRELLERGEAERAQRLAARWFLSNPRYTNPYQPAAEAVLSFYGRESKKPADGYRRGLDLEEGKAWVEFSQGGSVHRRELFSSARYQATFLRVTGKELNFELGLNRRPFEEYADGGAEALYLGGQCGDGVRYCAGCAVAETDGRVFGEGGYLTVEGASFAVVVFCVQTDYCGGDPRAACERLLAAAKSAGCEAAEAAHREDYGALYGTMELRLGGGEEALAEIPADRLLCRAQEPAVRAYLSGLLFSYARYLLISSSWRCELPANLQGIWNGSFTPPWESAYTININLQMNYWFADGAGLGCCYEPFLRLMERMLPNGRRTARRVYGCRGFVAHHNTNLWGDTDVTGLWLPAFLWVTGGAWMANQLYAHAMYEEDCETLRERILPILKECVLFFYDYLHRRSDGAWVCGPTVSPENTYRLPDGQEASVALGTAMDHQIIRELAENYLDGCARCGAAGEETDFARGILAHLPRTRLASDGRILEWQEEYEETEPGHRHISHLYGLYPGREISQEEPELWEGAKKTLACRLKNGGGHTGWSRAWIQCFYARLKDAESLDRQIALFLENSVAENLWDVHPPFQIDGNFGFAAAILEALASRRGDTVEVLRAVPESFRTGSVRGQRLAGQLRLDYAWECGRLTRLAVCSGKDQTVTLKYPGGSVRLCLNGGETAYPIRTE